MTAFVSKSASRAVEEAMRLAVTYKACPVVYEKRMAGVTLYCVNYGLPAPKGCRTVLCIYPKWSRR